VIYASMPASSVDRAQGKGCVFLGRLLQVQKVRAEKAFVLRRGRRLGAAHAKPTSEAEETHVIGNFCKASLMAAYQRRVLSFQSFEVVSSRLRRWKWFREG
jgi:hypothetical protein